MNIDKVDLGFELRSWSTGAVDLRERADLLRRMYSTLLEKHGDKDDARCSSFAKTINVLDSSIDMCHMILGCFNDASWWERRHGKLPEKELKIKVAQGLVRQSRVFSFFLISGFHSVIESSLRVLIRAIYPKGESQVEMGVAEFWKVRKRLLQEDLELQNVDKYTQALKGLSLYRNTSHNNGLFFPPNMKKDSFKWGNDTYEFIPKEMPPQLDWPVLLSLIDVLSEMLCSIVEHEKIRNIKHMIDPFGVKERNVQEKAGRPC